MTEPPPNDQFARPLSAAEWRKVAFLALLALAFAVYGRTLHYPLHGTTNS